jgi:apolipoprotein N-acyltransferase
MGVLKIPMHPSFWVMASWVIAYAVLNFVSFPGPDLGVLVWISLLPALLMSAHFFRLSQYLVVVGLAEFLKWILLIVWLRHVSWFAVLGISGVMGIYQLIWFIAFWKFRAVLLGSMGNWKWFASILGLGLLWAALEIGRSHAWGIPGATLATTQWKSVEVLQVLSMVGNYGLSALIVIANLCFFPLFETLRLRNWESLKSGIFRAGAGLLVIAGIVLLGFVRLNYHEKHNVLTHRVYRVAVVQPNQPAFTEWTQDSMLEAVETVFRLSASVANEDFDWMVWPEGTLPWSIHPGSAMAIEVSRLVHFIGRSLVGGNASEQDSGWFNAVVVFDEDGNLENNFYGKSVLVPFGEYIPMRFLFSGLETVVPIPKDFDRGTGSGVLQITAKDVKVNKGALICYEDCFPHLAVNRSRDGADLLFVATYNVWYGKEWGAYVHAAHSVLRSVEVGRPVLRCGSGGWSGFVDSYGQIRQVVTDENGSIYYEGVEIVEVVVPSAPTNTFFTRYFEWILALQVLGGVITFVAAICRR